MKLRGSVAIVAVLALCTSQGNAWWDGGHETVAYVAYQRLTPATRKRVDALLQRNPMYASWTQGIAADKQGLVAFVKAATWPDCIKSSICMTGYASDGGDVPPGNPTDAQNIGYDDHLMHKYWHFVDVPYSAGAPGQPPKEPNALTEIKLLTDAIGTDESDDLKSYDVVWLEHLVGDIHQPLHATSRFTKNHPNGDAGGNLVALCAKPCRDELHAYWDGLLGDAPMIEALTTIGNQLLKRNKPAAAAETDPAKWVDESFALAKSSVYVAPISDDNDPGQTISARPDATYGTASLRVAKNQALLAGYRLAELLNTHLK
jgi:S1/P1 Nuclease